MRVTASLLSILLAAAIVGAREVRVRPGETLTSIAARELGDGARWGEIARANGITDPNRIAVGRRLEIPGTGASTASRSDAASAPRSPAEALASARRAAERAEGAVGREALVGVWDEILAAEALARANWRADAVARAEAARVEADRILAASGRAVPEEAGVRASEGPVRVRTTANASWRDLDGETVVWEGGEVMTSSRGAAEIRLADAVARLAPNGILSVSDARIDAQGPRRSLRLSLGDVRVTNRGADPFRIGTAEAWIELRGPFEAHLWAARDGRYRAALLSGSGEIRAGNDRSMLHPGWEASGGGGARLEVGARAGSAPATSRLLFPERNVVLDGEEVAFSWEAVPGAANYRFRLRATGTGAELLREVGETELSVTNLPDGDFLWEVSPRDAAGNSLPAPVPSTFEIRRFDPRLAFTTVRRENGRLLLEGTAWPGARVGVTREWWTTAGSEGRFALEGPAPSAPSALLVGVSARSEGRNPRVARALVAAPTGGPAVTGDSLLPVVVWADTGAVTLFGGPVPATWRLFSGENHAPFVWEVDGRHHAAAARVAADLDAPEITEVTTTPERAKPGDEITIRVRAEDGPRGFATGLADEAWIWVDGPDGFERSFTPRGTNGVYEASFTLPRSMSSGILWVRRIEVRDRAGRSREIRAEGLASEVRDPREARRRGLRNGFFFGLGILVGAAF